VISTAVVHLLEPLYAAVTFVMVAFHKLFNNLGVDPASGLAWGGSIVGLVIVIRILLIPLFVKQINAQRGLQILQPEIKKLQAKYKGKTDPESKKKQQQEMMALYKDNGTNPLASCLPILLQAPIFFALFHVLNGIGKEPPKGKGFLTDNMAQQAADASIFGAHISEKFLGADSLNVQIVTVVMIILMSASTFLTQKQLMTKNMSAEALNNPFAQQQKILLYVFPLIFAVSGVNFPVGVLLYWLTTNIWSMGQQFYVIRRNPSPGSPAAEALAARKAAKEAKHHAESGQAPGAVATDPNPAGGSPDSNSNGSISGKGIASGGPATGGTGDGNGANGAKATGPTKPGTQRQQPRKKKKRR
jgi:YidC/Oxa1 family membrane protein insertase